MENDHALQSGSHGVLIRIRETGIVCRGCPFGRPHVYLLIAQMFTSMRVSSTSVVILRPDRLRREQLQMSASLVRPLT